MHIEAKEHVLAVLQAHYGELHRFGVRRYRLFGSFVRQEQRTDSDVDLLVEFETDQKSFQHFMQLAFFLEGILGRNVDIVTPESLSPYIGPRILGEVEYVAISA